MAIEVTGEDVIKCTGACLMKAVFLCGGIGRRMFPISEDKFLLSFLGKPLLLHQIELAEAAGIDWFVIVGNRGNIAAIERVIRDIPRIRTELVIQEKPLGIADALKCAHHHLRGQVLLVNPNDVFTITAYRSIIKESAKSSAFAYILGYEVNDYFPGGYLEVDSANRLKHIVEKPGQGKEPSKLVNIVVHLHNEPERLLAAIEHVQTSRDDVYETALNTLVREGCEIKIVPYADFWAPIKYPWHIFKVMEHFLDSTQPFISPTAKISDRAIIEGKVILGHNVRVLENAVIRGPVYVGDGSVIGNNALIRDYCHIGSGSIIGYCTEVKHSYIGDNCWFHSNYIGDSIIGDDCSFGAGAVTANLRLDKGTVRIKVGHDVVDTGYDKLGAFTGRGCRIGINASLMPGVRLGAGTFVGPGICLKEDVEVNKIVLSECKYRVRENRTGLSQNKS